MTAFDPGRAYAEQLDRDDPLASYRSRFAFPTRASLSSGRPADAPAGEDDEIIYFCGNSLGLMPHDVRTVVNEELDQWAARAVDGHFEGARPWYSYHEQFTDMAARLVGARPGEVVIMNGLTVNVHLLLVSFYRPTKARYKIVIEDSAFPSDRYAVQSQARHHGFDPDDAVVILKPRDGEALLRTEDIEAYFDREGDKVATVLLGGVNFYTGQAYDLKRIAAAAHKAGAIFGTDLAHAAGNLALQLHDDDVDFAAFCTYKYLNSGPGGVAGAYVHERHGADTKLNRFAGWWGNDPDERFKMGHSFTPHKGAAGWQLSNAPVLTMSSLLASMRMFDEVGMSALREKSVKLTGYLEQLLDHINGEHVDEGGGADTFTLITPRDPEARGCQLSIRASSAAKGLREKLQARGVITDFRPPDVIRVAPVPMYNSFVDVWKFAQVLKASVDA
jgi:kynureninase